MKQSVKNMPEQVIFQPVLSYWFLQLNVGLSTLF